MYPARRMGCLMPNISVMGVVIVAIFEEEGVGFGWRGRNWGEEKVFIFHTTACLLVKRNGKQIMPEPGSNNLRNSFPTSDFARQIWLDMFRLLITGRPFSGLTYLSASCLSRQHLQVL